MIEEIEENQTEDFKNVLNDCIVDLNIKPKTFRRTFILWV